ncbi:hypothetical protein DID88_001533 [Monilinia fructigena]|uniref:Terpene synthase N-terminal domain-containing protein n=1 Tax=Monilinia fructigena TaxID=38457 RepID=A0A395IXF4_9HELO|nr:hypothetical protein DID88_001533 [Monilinia fructigena]
MESSNLNIKAQILVQTLTNQVSQQHGSGSMSTAIYDTAWVSMITRETDSGTILLFPESFNYLLESQAEDGGWETYASTVDGILNTGAALLSLIKFSTTQNASFSGLDLRPRIASAVNHLMTQLHTWDVKRSDYVGFEILVPALLDMLEEYNIQFEFPGRSILQTLRDVKMAKFRPEILYGPCKTTLLHSLEAFIGKIDFNRVVHHKTNGHFMASPSSTAAYLMNCSVWDQEAELYLRNAVANSIGKGTGSVPCAFPTTIFEVTWILSTLLKSHFSNNVLGPYNLSILSEFLKKELKVQGGIVGFAPLVLADADDTAKTIETLNLLGDLVAPEEMISTYETVTHFQTYKSERTASFSANCNVLSALLHVEKPSCYIKEIVKAASFLSRIWSLGKIQDKWNTSVHYSMMLLAQSLRNLLTLWSQGKLPSLPKNLVEESWKQFKKAYCFAAYNEALNFSNSHHSWSSELMELTNISDTAQTHLADNRHCLSIEMSRRFSFGWGVEEIGGD